MYILIPEDVNFKISTTDINVYYSERGAAKILIDVIFHQNLLEQKYSPIQIFFQPVAEMRCITLNYYESNYENYVIESSSKDVSQSSDFSILTGFYQVKNSTWLEQSVEKYDPKNRLNLAHYLITGNDSYIELLASKYLIA